MRILAFCSGTHDAAAAAFDDYELVAAVQEERLRREKGWGGAIPWLAIDEVLRIAGWSRTDVDVIAQTRGTYPTQYLRFPLARDLYYTAQRWTGRERARREIRPIPTRCSAATASSRRTRSVPIRGSISRTITRRMR
jgi:predicted NodU family carbamoyl transferase